LSGFFWARKVEAREELRAATFSIARRIIFLFFAWSAIYLLPTNLIDSFDFGVLGPVKKIVWHLNSAVSRPWNTIIQGTKEHLWYLVGLLCSMSITALFVWYGQRIFLMIIAIAFYVIGLAGGAYSATPLGFQSEFNFRNGPFFSLIFFATGYFLHLKNPGISWFKYGSFIALIGALLHIFEIWILHAHWNVTMDHDYVASTYFFGLGVAMIGLSNSSFLNFSRAAEIGPLVVGIYTAHMIFVDLLKPVDRLLKSSPIWSVTYIITVFFLSYIFVKMLLRIDFTRKLVS